MQNPRGVKAVASSQTPNGGNEWIFVQPAPQRVGGEVRSGFFDAVFKKKVYA